MTRDWRTTFTRVAVAAGVVLLGAATAYLIPSQPLIAVLIPVAVLALGLSAADAAIIPLLSIPLMLVVVRIGAGGIDLSVSDAVLIACTAVAFVFAVRPFSPEMRNVLWLTALYQFATLFTVLLNPYLSNVVEWVHAWVLVGGAALVGWTIGRAGHARAGMWILLMSALALALITLGNAGLQYLQGDFGPVYVRFPYAMHKNFVGTVLGFAAVIAYANPKWMGWSTAWSRAALITLMAGMAATQSRQAILGLGAALLFIAWRERRQGRRPWLLALFVVIPAAVVVGTMVRDQVESENQFNSVFQRVTWLTDTLDFWLQSPWIGHGLRYWYRGIPGMNFQPPNAEIEVLASAGVVGLVGFLIMLMGLLVIAWRLPREFGTVAFAVIIARLAQAQFDLFWSAVQSSIPFLVLGICLGASALHDQGHAVDELAASSRNNGDSLVAP